MTAQEAIKAGLADLARHHPDLGREGYRARSRPDAGLPLVEVAEEVEAALAWLRMLTPTRFACTPSAALQAASAAAGGSVGEGALIGAALLLGLPMRRPFARPGALIGVRLPPGKHPLHPTTAATVRRPLTSEEMR